MRLGTVGLPSMHAAPVALVLKYSVIVEVGGASVTIAWEPV